MSLSLKSRINASFVAVSLMALSLTFMVFYYLNSLNTNIAEIIDVSNRDRVSADQIISSIVTIIKHEKKMKQDGITNETVEQMKVSVEVLASQLGSIDAKAKDDQIKEVIKGMVVQNDKIRNLLAKVSVGQESRVDPGDVMEPELDVDGAGNKDALRPLVRGESENFGQITDKKAMALSREGRILSEISEAATGILDMYTQLQERQQSRNDARNQQINRVIEETKKYMMITLIIGFLTTIIAGLVVPGKVVLPFKKIRDVIRELRECNFDVTISYGQDDEIGEIAREMNKMIVAMKKFDELRRNLVELELRKFDILANMIHTPVLVGGADGQIHYINNSLYSLLGVESDQVISKTMIATSMPRSIIDAYELAIKRRAKIENIEVVIPRKKVEGEEVPEGEDYLFQGYANIVPVRSKESSHDYYLMVMSAQAFV